MKEENKSDKIASEHSLDIPSDGKGDFQPPTNDEYNLNLKERIEEKRKCEIIKYDELPIKAKLFAEWLSTTARYGNVDSLFLIYKHEDDRYGCKFYTDSHSYHISIRVPKSLDDNGYAGCTSSTRKSRVGEDWDRGSDLPDGNYSQETFNKIDKGIIRYELKTLQLWR